LGAILEHKIGGASRAAVRTNLLWRDLRALRPLREAHMTAGALTRERLYVRSGDHYAPAATLGGKAARPHPAPHGLGIATRKRRSCLHIKHVQAGQAFLAHGYKLLHSATV
jgi:hypothetical protein